jgi:hypothetical protein
VCCGAAAAAAADRACDTQTRDTLLWKVLRNLSAHTMALHADAAAAADAAARRKSRARQEGGEPGAEDDRRTQKGAAVIGASRKLRGLWAPWVPKMVELAQHTDNHDLLAELLGTLANMTMVDLPAAGGSGGGKGGGGGGGGRGGKGGGRRRGESDDSEESDSDGGKDDDEEGKDGGEEDGQGEYDGTMHSVRGGWMRLVDSHGLLPFLQRLLQPGFLQVLTRAMLSVFR